MIQLTKFSYTGILEVYHSVLSKWAPKSTHFSYKGIVARCKLAAINFNQGEIREQAKTKSGDYRYLCFSKITKTWAVKPVKYANSLDVFSNLVDLTEKSVIETKKLTQLSFQIYKETLHQLRSLIKKIL